MATDWDQEAEESGGGRVIKCGQVVEGAVLKCGQTINGTVVKCGQTLSVWSSEDEEEAT